VKKEKFTIKELMRPNILKLVPYSSARSEYIDSDALLLDANEHYRDFVGNDGRNRYPDPQHTLLKKKIEEVLKLPAKKLAIGSGSDELIDLLFRIFCTPKKDKALLISPTYGAYEVFAAINDVAVSHCQLKGDFTIDLNKMEAVCSLVNNGTPESGMHKLLFICSPNNPSGNSFPLEQIEMMVNRFQGVVVVDEAYIDFSKKESAVKLLDKYDNLVVLRTLSKAWALADARVGIAISSDEIIKMIHNVKYPYNLSGISQQLAMATLDNYSEVQKHIELIVQQRERVASALKEFKFVDKVYPSEANFLLVRVLNDPVQLLQTLRDEKIIIRNRSNTRGCYQSVRISIGSVEDNNRLLDALKRIDRDYDGEK